MLADVGGVLECLVVGIDLESGARQMIAELFDRSDDASGQDTEGRQ